jgi:hypothetical protein
MFQVRLISALNLLQLCLFALAGWEKPWVEQIIDRVMKGMLKTTEERAQAVVSSWGEGGRVSTKFAGGEAAAGGVGVAA